MTNEKVDQKKKKLKKTVTEKGDVQNWSGTFYMQVLLKSQLFSVKSSLLGRIRQTED